ncbi:hypothetical protein NQ317_015050 [Molorchus minor]|uniref:Uncharacterized protein n=1 Tax=Molorchus minor TaxID=1323400 RepID=A0ABQ9K4I8_9CUCU|nr:hypothetical protein NQ317_015050 [Molorchus minor]
MELENRSETSSSAEQQSEAGASLVPPPQPAKANNKTHKKNEINQKGANKEGTDMDAFNDNMVDKEEVNANITANSNDIINANSVSIANNTPTTVTVEPSKKQNDSNEITTIKSEPLKTLKTKVDITDIVKDKPKPIKPFTVATESQDEPDRFRLKNEANAKANSENGNERPTLPYRKGQWWPNDPNGDKVYFKDFLMAVRELPLSRRKPDNIPDVVFMDERERARLSDTRPSLGGSRTDFTTPPFNSYGGGKSGSQRGVLPKRNSQTKMGGSGLKASKTRC